MHNFFRFSMMRQLKKAQTLLLHRCHLAEFKWNLLVIVKKDMHKICLNSKHNFLHFSLTQRGHRYEHGHTFAQAEFLGFLIVLMCK